MYEELLAHRVVGLIEGTAFPHLDATSVIGLIALVLTGAGLVTVADYALGGRDRLPLLVAEPFPRVEASLGVELALTGLTGALCQQLHRHAAHPAVDALVVVTAGDGPGLLPGEIGGVPVRCAVVTDTRATDSVR